MRGLRVKGSPVIEWDYPMGTAPSIGTIFLSPVNSKHLWKRIVSDSQISADVANIVHKYPYRSASLEPGWPGTKLDKGTGDVIVPSRQAEREICEMSKDRGMELQRR